MIIYGGYVAGERTSAVYQFNLDTHEWVKPEITGPSPPVRSNHSAVSYTGSLYIFGGANEEDEKLNDLWKLELNCWQWTELKGAGDTPSPRSGHTAAAFKHHMIIFGGVKDLAKETNEMLSYGFNTNEWLLIQEEHQIKDPITAEQIEELKKSRSSYTNPELKKSPMYNKWPSKKSQQGPPIDMSPPKRKKQPQATLYDGPPAPLVGRVKGSAPHPRDGHSAVLYENSVLLIFGGDRHQMPFNDAYSFKLNEEFN